MGEEEGSGVITAQVRAWDTAVSSSFLQARMYSAVREAVLFQVTLGNPNATPPDNPATMTGLTSFELSIPVPEPSTLALAGLGSAAMLVMRRRPQAGLNYPAATNPAMTSRCDAEDKSRR